jgi:Cu(I)/Ag(I) efflux system protein CusF
MKRMLWLGLFGIIGMGVSGIGLAAADNAAATAVSATGVVVQVKADEGRVKINHDPIPALKWPGMTMFFRVKDQAVLKGIAAGDKVRFELGKDTAGHVIVRMEKVAK